MKPSFPPILKAVFPVAGLGTRFLPATKAAPKEMLSVVNKPLIQYAVEEAYTAGIRQMIFVTCHNKRTIEDHFDSAYELEHELLLHHKMELLDVVNSVKPEDMECFYVRQSRPLGLGHAVLCAETLVGHEPFAVLLADDLLTGKVPIMKQMVDLYHEFGSNILAVQEVNYAETDRYGIVAGTSIKEGLVKVTDVIEKPRPELAPSRTAIVGRYILSEGIFSQIRALAQHPEEEIQLTDAIRGLLQSEQTIAYHFKGTRYDCGSILGFLKANVDLGRVHPVEGECFTQWLFDTIGKEQLGR